MTNAETAPTKTQFTLSEAARITGKSRTTLRGYLNKGRLSAEVGEAGQKFIDGAELCRYFGNDLDFSLAAPGKTPATGGTPPPSLGQGSSWQVESLQRQLEREIDERGRERSSLEKQIDRLNDVIERMQEGHAKAMLLLEDRTRDDRDWRAPLEALKEQVARQQQEHQELRENAKRRIARLNQALEQERSRSLWDRLFQSLAGN